MDGVKRTRSPNYPGSPLGEAVRRATLLYDKTSGQEVNLEIAAKACGFRSLSGPSRQLLSAMGKYGLVDLKRGKVATTARARVLRYKGVSSPEARSELERAILDAPLFSDLWEKRQAPDEQLIFDLVELGFSDPGARRAVKCFRESVEFAGLTEDSEVFNDRAEPTEAEVEHASSEFQTSAPALAVTRSPTRAAQSYRYSWPLSPDITAELGFSRQPNPEDIDALCDYLEVMKRQLARQQREEAEPAA